MAAKTETAIETAAREGGATDVDAQAIERPGALAPATEYMQNYRVSDLIPTPSKWADYPQRKLETLKGKDLILADVMFFESLEYQDKDWFIALCSDVDTGEIFTTSGGGGVITGKLHRLAEMVIENGPQKRAFPLVGRFTLNESSTKGHQDYWDLL